MDGDDDGHRADSSPTVISTNPSCLDSGEAVGSDPSDDCNDGDADVYPGATEACNDVEC